MSTGKDLINVLMFDAAFPPPVVGGKEKQAILLAKSLVRKGIDVDALSYIHNDNESEVVEGVNIARFASGLFLPIKLFIALFRRRFTFKILHIHTPSRIGKLVAFFGFVLNYKILFKFPNEKMLDSLSFLDRVSWKGLFKAVDTFVVLEEDTQQKLLELKVPARKIFYIYNGVEINDKKRTENNRESLKLIFVGRLEKQKKCDDLIKAASILKDKQLDFKLLIIGDGSLREDLEKLVDSLSLNNIVQFSGYQKDTLSYMQDADILILPSENEGMSNVLLEAISIGLPIIVTDVGSSRIQVGSFGEQFLCPVNNPDCLADKIYNLSLNDALRDDYGSYLYERAQKLFSIEVITDNYIERYKKLL